jgi:phage terminase small subunit
VGIKKYIEDIMASKSSDRIASQDEILEGLTRIARGIEEEEVVTITQLGEVVRTERTPTNKDKLRAWELLGKRYRLFTDKIEANVSQQIIFEGEDALED